MARAARDEAGEVAAVVEAVRRLHDEEAVPFEEIAVLYRINARSEPFEEAFAAAGIPYQVRDGAFLRRAGPRAMLQRLRRAGRGGSLAEAVEAITAELGYDPEATPDSDEEVTRQSDLARMRSLATEFARSHPAGDAAAFLAELTNRFSAEESGRGVNLLTYHRAKGLEFDAVFLLDWSTASSRSARVGRRPTRRKNDACSTSGSRAPAAVPVPHVGRRSQDATEPIPRRARALAAENDDDCAGRPRRAGHLGNRRSAPPAFEGLATQARKPMTCPPTWCSPIARLRRSRTETADSAHLASIHGVGPAKLERYADEILEIVGRS